MVNMGMLYTTGIHLNVSIQYIDNKLGESGPINGRTIPEDFEVLSSIIAPQVSII